ncbi:MAG TPA: hypothetical protein VMD30_08545, partial [Tepidisphaeraceae bacterium]|nr:hypothetical protein [Tepidisphaeraceae bacterium]
NDAPIDMTAASTGLRFDGDYRMTGDSTFFIGLLGGDQMIAKLPDQGLFIQCQDDSPPIIVMQSPALDITLPPTADLTIAADIKDDYGVASARLLVGDNDADPAVVTDSQQNFSPEPTEKIVHFALHLQPAEIVDSSSVTVQVSATDNRQLTDLSPDLGPQTAMGPRIRITFRDPKQIAEQQAAQTDRLTALLVQMLTKQVDLAGQTARIIPQQPATQPSNVDRDAMSQIHAGQIELRGLMHSTAATFPFDSTTLIIQKTLQMLELNPATEAVDLSAAIISEPVASQQMNEGDQLSVQQQTIISTLRALLAHLGVDPDAELKMAGYPGVQYPNRADAFKKLDEALKTYIQQQQHILAQMAPLVRNPVDNYDTQDKDKLNQLRQAEENLDAFMQAALADFSKNAEQDLSNPSLVKEMAAIYSDVTMAANALKQQPVQIAVPLEENGLEDAKELESNLQRWLSDTPDRTQWTQEDMLTKNDTPMPELPAQLQDMVGQLLEQQEDLDQQMEDANANWQDSMDKGVGWDAADGPIADMSAKGVTGNVLPNDNEMQGRSGEGRSGRSEGEFVGDTAVGKGGRNTPTRLEPTPFESGQIKDTSKDPVGGATGGGKISGEGSSGLEGPVPPEMKDMQRLASAEAQIRNAAERLNLQYQIDRYDNFKMAQSILLMRRLESDLDANRYENALRDRDVIVSDLQSSRLLVGGAISVAHDTTPTANTKTQKEINAATQGDYPPAWSAALQEYYRKLASQ